MNTFDRFGRRTRLCLGVLAWCLGLVACSSAPTPAWQLDARAEWQNFSDAYLRGDEAAAQSALARARRALASTGKADLLARAELLRCAVRVASLAFDHCAAYQPYAFAAAAPELAYAAYLNAAWQDVDVALLPKAHQALAQQLKTQADAGSKREPLDGLSEPLARLVAAGVLLQSGRLTAQDAVLAVQTASDQGWRKPLLAWLALQRQQALAAGLDAQAQAVQQRMELILSGAQVPP